MKLNKVIAIPVLALAGGLGLAACGNQAAPHAAPAVTHTVTPSAAASKPTTPAPTTPAPTTPAPAPVKTVYVQAPAAPAPAAPAAPALTNCGMFLYAGANTSCAFAQNVAGNYTGPGADYAYSPVTGLNYTMNCTEGVTLVVCTGGNNAYVQWNA